MKKLCIIHTTPTTVNFLKPLAQTILDGIQVYNLLDDSILPEINAKGKITKSVRRRFQHMLKIAAEISPDAILVACSTIGELAYTASETTNIPVIRIDEKMCMDAVEAGTVIGIAATLSSTLPPTCNLLIKIADEKEKQIEIRTALIKDANQLLNDGKGDEYDRIVSTSLAKLASQYDIVVLAQVSMARTLDKILTDREKYLTSPISGLEYIKCIL